MSSHEVSRRTLLGAGAAATAVTAIGGAGAANASEPITMTGRGQGDGQPRFGTESVPALQQGEQVIFYTPGGLVPNGFAAGASMIYDGSLAGARTGTLGETLSASINIPLGSRLTGVDFVMAGNPLGGTINVTRYLPLVNGDHTVLHSQVISGSGITVYSTATLDELFDGTQTFEAYFTTSAATCVCKGIRARYVPVSFGLIPITPARVYDSRFNMTPDANGPISAGASRTISVAAARNPLTGVRTGDIVVPASATAVAFTVTVAGTVGGGYLAVNPGGATAVTASSINWSSTGQVLANTGVVKLNDSRQITVVQGGGATDFIIDIVGYYA
ncbi:unannotated protein [freshwater metagenome]|uniref:Unannotated protein n=1 Tax=freshwater metagenome TaxID=449393 RepID=A0A6J7DYC8_9ZZZZ|nr:hypothetical protein [Actinomycetota bacterium]